MEDIYLTYLATVILAFDFMTFTQAEVYTMRQNC